MSTKDIAARFEANKANRANSDTLALRRTTILDERFQRLREELNTLFTEQVDELNHDERVGNVLAVTSDDKQIRVSYAERVLAITFNPQAHTVRLSHVGAVKFDYTIKIELNTTLSPYLTKREGRKEFETLLDQNVSALVVEKAISALLNV